MYFSHDTASIAGVISVMDTLCGTLDPETKQRYHPLILAAIAFVTGLQVWDTLM